ncbi:MULTISPECIES: hypothetical protein [Streptomyces]|uniref:hypothetical protein n=1 Tax=Streptomyces TaxID=1883 RepID=UPI0029B45C30|nr:MULTISPECIES: hypothetical protein [unclassified Streptomyces]MDX3092344.1 hypothetical protein [Streptomyces sp. ME12-02E]MDX3335709.1 hypothetical protein [Streptomyces sp. ME02-6978a]WTI29255.1 hypothetical protein OHA67_24480 [Streptomyces jietaisiensis]
MSFEEQWASARTQAAIRTDPDGSAGMTLASADGNGSGGGGRLVYLKYPWTDGARILGELRTTTNTSVSQLTEGKKGGAAGTKGLASALAMDAVRDSWHRRLKALRDECEDLEGPMRQAAKDHGENEARIKAAMAAERTLAEPFEKGR